MRNKAKFHYASNIEETDKLLRLIERKLSDEIIRKCRIEWSTSKYYRSGYVIDCDYYHDKDTSKSFELYITADSYSVSIRIEESTYYKVVSRNRETTTKDYKDFRFGEIPTGSSYDKEAKKMKKLAVSYIVDMINSYFGSNAIKFIINS